MRRSYHALCARLLAILALALALALSLGPSQGLAWAEGEHGAPSASASSAAPSSGAEVKVREKVVFVFQAARSGHDAAARAREANRALDVLLAHSEQLGDVHFEETQGTAVIYVGKTPLLTLGPEDVAASGDASLEVLAGQVTARTADAVASERKRSAIATTVFSVSLLVFSALIAFWLLGRAGELAERMRAWMAENPERVTAIRLGKIELVSAGAARGGSSIALTLAHRFTQIAIAYAWLIFGLSLFESTRGYTTRLTGAILAPVSALATRVSSGLPVVVLAGIAVLAVSVLVRFIGLFFDSVARGDTRITWLSKDLARPTSVLVRYALVVGALVLGAPLITGETDGALSRVGMIALVALAIACTPLLASAAVGAVVVYGRRIKRGELVEIGGRSGRITEVRLLDVRLEDVGACDVSVPHLLGLWHPTRVHRHPPLATVEVVVDPAAALATVEKALLEAARKISSRARVELIRIDATGAYWRVHSATHRGDQTLGAVLQDAIIDLGVQLGPRSSLTSLIPRPIGEDDNGGAGS
jgi:small-conductance mechanosensitive channel